MSSIPAISNGSSSTLGSTPQVDIPQQTLGQADFLKLLVAQMTSQDPLHPQSNTDFIAQMASFSTLQSSQSMQSDMAALQANSLIGRTVSVTSANNTETSGVVSAVQLVAGKPQIVVKGQSYDLSQISSILPTLTPDQSSTIH